MIPHRARSALAWILGGILCVGNVAGCGRASDDGRGAVRLATTHTVRDSGLLEPLVAACERATGLRIETVVVATGHALALGERGDADVLLVHDRVAEERFVAAGHGVARADAFWSRFLVVGPPVPDDAKPDWERAYATMEETLVRPGSVDSATGERVHGTVRTRPSAAAYLRCVARYGGPFVSRGDDSGTHRKERALLVGVAVPWTGYVEAGQGMTATLRIADERAATTLCDEPTYRQFAASVRLVPKVEGDFALRNDYGAILVTPDAARPAATTPARRMFEWLASSACHDVVETFRVAGVRVFFAPGEEPSRAIPGAPPEARR